MNVKGIGIPENKENVFAIYREFGGRNIPKLIDAVNKRLGLRLSAPTLYAWAKEGGWDERIKRADNEHEKAQAAGENTIEKMIFCLESQKDRYEAYFQTLPPGKMDNMAVSSYMGLINAIASLKQKTEAFKGSLFLEFMREQINWISVNDPDALQMLEKNFNDFTAHMKEKYA